MMTTIKVYACYTVKIYKKQTPQNSNRGARARRAGPGSAFDIPLNDTCKDLELDPLHPSQPTPFLHHPSVSKARGFARGTFRRTYHVCMRGSRWGVGGGGPDPPPLEFAKLNIANITGNEKN